MFVPLLRCTKLLGAEKGRWIISSCIYSIDGQKQFMLYKTCITLSVFPKFRNYPHPFKVMPKSAMHTSRQRRMVFFFKLILLRSKRAKIGVQNTMFKAILQQRNTSRTFSAEIGETLKILHHHRMLKCYTIKYRFLSTNTINSICQTASSVSCLIHVYMNFRIQDCVKLIQERFKQTIQLI